MQTGFLCVDSAGGATLTDMHVVQTCLQAQTGFQGTSLHDERAHHSVTMSVSTNVAEVDKFLDDEALAEEVRNLSSKVIFLNV